MKLCVDCIHVGVCYRQGAVDLNYADKCGNYEVIRKGHWIEYDDECECPFCHKTWNYCDNDTQDFDHCPKCGALLVDMRGAE